MYKTAKKILEPDLLIHSLNPINLRCPLPLYQKAWLLPRNVKRFILAAADSFALVFSLWSAYALRFSDWWPPQALSDGLLLFIFIPLAGIPIFARFGLYRAVIRFMGTRVLRSIAMGVGLIVVGTYTLIQLVPIAGVPRSVPIIFGLCAWIYLGGSRLMIRSYYHWIVNHLGDQQRVIIYGAGGAGVQLANSLRGGAEYVPVAFVDDDRSLWKSDVAGFRVFSPADLDSLIPQRSIDVILLALPSLSEARRAEILRQLNQHPVSVKTMPSMPEIIAGEAIDAVRSVAIEDLLGRDSVAPSEALVQASLAGKSVCITGAGGSIGSELSRQALQAGCATLILYESSEFALYQIESELRRLAIAINSACELIPILGSVLDEARLAKTFTRFSVQTVYHAAAYKHVPLVEHNVLQGIENNSMGTLACARAANAAAVQRFILVSTDKAVRPTNVMGASKRLAELFLQDMATRSQTVFSMVRFGNVLGSSGSVVPVFKEQIQSGGPVTVTHPEINRFFMTIPEAASLVIQAGSMAKGGEVYVLDMGEPVKIVDLACSLIRLSGRTVLSDEQPDGDIEIVFTGLRPGEKLYEELLIGDNVQGTAHPKIMAALEEQLPSDELERFAGTLRAAIKSGDSELARVTLQEAVRGFTPASQNSDWLSANAN